MPYSLAFIPAFERGLKKFDPQQKEIIKLALKALLTYFSTNSNLIEAQKVAPRFFFKQLRKPFYEAGVEGKLRIVLRKDDLVFVAVVAGNHDQIKQFLARS
jgi:mRNA-degrading endonuclease RelE of RelBE toxin-antitoxin system